MSSNQVYLYPLVVREAHLDTFGHVNNATYLQIFEEARWQIVTDNGFGLKEVRQRQQGPIILEVNLKFQKELRLRERIVIHTQLLAYNGKIAKLRQWIANEKGESAADSLFTIAFFDMRERKIITPTPEWLKALGVPPTA